MKFPNPLSLKVPEEHSAIISGCVQIEGTSPGRKKICVTQIPDECFALSSDLGLFPEGDIAPVLIAETALWAYKHIRVRPTYQKDKGLFINHIFRTSNLTLWQKQKDPSYSKGLAASLLIAIIGSWRVWVGSVGDISAWTIVHKKLHRLTHDDVDDFGIITKSLGSIHYGLKPQFYVSPLMVGDILFIGTSSVMNFIHVDDLQTLLSSPIDTREDIQNILHKIINISSENGNDDNKIACLIKRIPVND